MGGLRTGYTTGTSAACAAGIAIRRLLGEDVRSLTVTLPDGERAVLKAELVTHSPDSATVGVRKDAGDDPDDTDKVLVVVTVEKSETPGIGFKAGPGVGIVTKPGLSVPVGEAAVNPVPRLMIERAIREVTDLGILVTIAVPGGEEIARKTFNPRLGIVGGLSILGTSGRVCPRSGEALRKSLRLLVRTAAAQGILHPILVPGNIGARAARRHFSFAEDALIQASNEWETVLDELSRHRFEALLAVGHAGKLAKLIDGHFQTRSGLSPSALPTLRRIAETLHIRWKDDADTVEGFFTALPSKEREELAHTSAALIRRAIESKLKDVPAAVALIDMNGDLLGTSGDQQPWSL